MAGTGPGPPGAASPSLSHRDQPRTRPPCGPASLGQLVLLAELARRECPKGWLFADVCTLLFNSRRPPRRGRDSRRSRDSAAASAGERGPSEGQSRRLASSGLSSDSDERRGARSTGWSGPSIYPERQWRARLPTRNEGARVALGPRFQQRALCSSGRQDGRQRNSRPMLPTTCGSALGCRTRIVRTQISSERGVPRHRHRHSPQCRDFLHDAISVSP